MALAYLDVARATRTAYQTNPDSEEARLLGDIRDRKQSLEVEQERFRTLCDRWDNLYYPQGFTRGGASHWSTHESAYKPGMSHVSINAYPAYVEIPASLQSVEPIENMVATDTNPQARQIAAMVERLYFAWKKDQDYELKAHKACVVKGLYGRTASKVYWDDEEGKVEFEVVDQPRNLYLGWRDSNYEDLEWALYCYAITGSTALEEWGLHLDSYTEDGKDGQPGAVVPFVVAPTAGMNDSAYIASMFNTELRVEVYDYWYRKPKPGTKVRFGKPTKFETWNAIFVGNVMVQNVLHAEYEGELPYIPLFNNYIPGVPDGRPELYDIEQLLREKDEKISENSQMMSRAVSGQMWQLTGQEAPDTVPQGLKPTPNNVVAPGAGNRLESIQPWMPEYQMEGYINRIDRDLADVSGLNDLLRGLAPNQVLSSSKAIATLVANYETRIRMKRDLYYVWRGANWKLASKVWANKKRDLKPILLGAAALETVSPSLTPRDDGETANIALSLKEGKLMSQVRAMDKIGIDDPETEMDIIRSEQTDATLNPAAVQVMVTLMATLQQLQVTQQQMQQQLAQQGAPQGGPGAATLQGGGPPPTQAQMLNDARQLGPSAAGQGPSMNGPNDQPLLPPDQMPANTPEGAALTGPAAPGAGPAPGAPAGGPPGSQVLSQFQIKGGQSTGRIIGQTTVQKGPKAGG